MIGLPRQSTRSLESTRTWRFSGFRCIHRFVFVGVSLQCFNAKLSVQVMELTSMRLLHRTTPSDRLDGPPMFRCAISYEAALAVAKDLKVPLNELMWEPA